MTLPMPLYNVYNSSRSPNSRYTTFFDVMRPFVSLTLLFTMSVLWAYQSSNDIITQDPRVYYFTVGTIFSNISVSFGRNDYMSTNYCITRFTNFIIILA